MAGKKGGLTALWKSVDAALASANKKAKRILLMLRFAAVFMVLIIVGSWGLAVASIFRPELAAYFYLGAVVILSIGLMPWAALLILPLRLKSVTKLIDKGYPANAREMGIRVIARKLHEESIETEELLFGTAINEGKKMMRNMQAKARADAEAAAAEANWMPRDDGPAGAPPPRESGAEQGKWTPRDSDDDAGPRRSD